MPTTNGSAELPDKQYLYGEWLRGQKWKRQLQKSVSHKALDIAEGEEVNLSVNKSSGITAAGAMGIAAAAGIPSALVAILLLLKGGGQPASPPPYPGPADSAYTVRFYDKDGKLIDVPHISQKPKGQ